MTMPARDQSAEGAPAARPFAFWYGSAPMSYIRSVAGPDKVFVRGEGCWLVDRGGGRFLDGRSGIGNMVLGYSRPDIAEAMYRQALELPFVPTLRYDRPAAVTIAYADALADVAPAGLNRIRFTHTGSSAVESALLMARRYHVNLGRTGRHHVIGLVGGYHGSTLMTMAAGGEAILRDGFEPMPGGFHHVPPPDAAQCPGCQAGAGPDPEDQAAPCAAGLIGQAAAIGPDQVACVIVEPVAGLSGIPLPGHFLRAVQRYCAEHDILLIFDEVFSGLGRMGPVFAAGFSGVRPDIMCLSKTLTAGYSPLGAVLATDAVYQTFDQPGRYFAHGSSTDAHPVSCAAGLATLAALFGEGALGQGARLGDRVCAALSRELKDCELVAGVRSTGPYIAVDVRAPAGAEGDFRALMNIRRHLAAQCEDHGVLIDFTPYTMVIVPPYVMPDEDADLLVDRVATVFGKFRPQDVDPARLRPPSASGRR
jgi:adenosylmethionine-8-amino-7-oxononanoate aminotransferase